MPTVPRYERQVREDAVPAVSLKSRPPEAGFRIPGDEIARLGGAVSNVIEKAQEEADKVKIQGSRNSLNKWEIDNVYDYKNGAAAKTGEESFQIVPQLKESLDKFAADHKETLANDRQRQAFDAMVAERWGQVEQWANQHMARQLDIVKETTYKATLESSKDRAAANPASAETELAVMNQAIVDQYGGKLGPEAVSEEMKKNETDLHRRVIDAYLRDGADELARGYLQAKKERIDPDDIDQIETKIKRREAELGREKQERLSLAAVNIIESTGDFNSIPKPVIEAMDVQTRSALRSYADKLAKSELETDWSTYYDLKKMAAAPGAGKDTFLKEDLLKYRDKLADTEFKEIVGLQSKIRNGEDGEKLLGGWRTEKMVVDDALLSAGINPNDDKDQTAKMHRMVDDRVKALQEQKGKKLSDDEFQKVVDDVTMRVTVKRRGWFDPEKNVFQLKPTDVVVTAKESGDVPDEERVKIVETLQRNGIPVTDKTVVDFYNYRIRKAVRGE